MEVSARLPGLDSCFKYCPSVAQFLLERGLEPNLADAEGSTCLHYMAEIGCASAVKRLLDYGADLDRENESGLTARNVADREGHRRVQQCLDGQSIPAAVDMETRWFSRRRGQGYITNSIIGDIYFEHSIDPGHGLEEGSKLEFSLNWDDFGPVAVDVHHR